MDNNTTAPTTTAATAAPAAPAETVTAPSPVITPSPTPPPAVRSPIPQPPVKPSIPQSQAAPVPNPAIPTPVPQPAPQQLISQFQTAPQDEEPLGFRQKLDAGEEHWRWKLSFRAALLLFAVIGTGCLGWATQTAQPSRFYWLYDDQVYLWWGLITFGITIVWTLVYILVLVLRRPPRPVHPGVAVGLDLVLWLAYICTTLFVVVACASVLSFGADGYIGRYSSSGYYSRASNGTWVFSPTDYMLDRGRARDCDTSSSTSTSSYYRSYGEPYFSSCAEQDAWVNALYRESRHRGRVEVTGAVCQGVCLVLHFILFVWACVDTHRRNRRRPTKEAEKLAAEIVGRMVREGAILQAPNPWRYAPLGGQTPQQQPMWFGQGANPGYTVHQGAPPPLAQNQHVMSGGRQTPGITEHYGDVKGVGLGGPGPSQQQQRQQQQPVVEHYGNEKGAGNVV